VINLHAAYEARLGSTTQGPIEGIVYTTGTRISHGRGGNGCAEPDCAVNYNGGLVQHSPHVYLLLWGPNWLSDPSQAATAAHLESFYQGLGVQPQDNWSTTMSQYGDSTGPPTFGGSVYEGASHDISTPPLGVTPSQLATEADAFAAKLGITDVNDAQIVIATQSGTCPAGFYAPICSGSGRDNCGWHSNSNEPYTNLPYLLDAGGACGEDFVNSNGTYDGFSMVGGHEYADTITDPYPSSGWSDLNDLGGGEIADKCAWSPHSADVSLSVGTSTESFAMQPLWSNSAYVINSANGCVMSKVVNGDVTVAGPGSQSNYQNARLNLQVIGTSSDGFALTWSASGLPSGLTINPSSGLISGQVTGTPNTYNVTVSASDSTGTSSVSFSWTVTADVGTTITNQSAGKCLNDHGYWITPGNSVVMWTCNTAANEQWSHPTNTGELIVLGQCLTDPGHGGAGALQVIEPCTGAANQEWYHNGKNEYVVMKNLLCLTDPNGSTTVNGDPLVMETCTGASDQRWSGS
jgi:serine protease